ncbi:phage tail tube protein [Acetobacter indonesiensis]|uniref:phage tail tube protein n=1 Tax=Acetobacter indonesiensis TaxID=104101 RepID=UPI0020A43F71|nr:phage tail tube protein [Acetobacter indonesiensis]MCP1231722.1 phage tail tube protein [Acetobacter indonesiensis]
MAYTGATTGYAAGEQTNTSPVDYALETTYNTAPGGTYQRLRITGESLAVQDGTSTPDEINDLPEDAETVLTSRSVSGSVNGALSYGTYDDFLAAILGNDWMAAPAAANAPIVVAAGNSVQISYGQSANSGQDALWSHTTAATAGNVFATWPATGIVRVTDAANKIDVFAAYQSIKTGGTTLLFAPGAFSSVYTAIANMGSSNAQTADLSVGATITLVDIVNAKLGKTFTFRKKLSGKFQHFTGCMISQVQIQLQKGQPPTVQIDVVGSDMAVSTVDISGSVKGATASPLMDTVVGFLGCTIFGSAPAGCVQSATITLARNNSGQDTGMGHVGACGVQLGSLKASMDIEYFFKDFTEFTAWQAGKKGAVSVSIKGADGYGYQFTLLNGRIFNPKNPISGKNATIVTTVSVTGNRLPNGGTVVINRIVPS